MQIKDYVYIHDPIASTVISCAIPLCPHCGEWLCHYGDMCPYCGGSVEVESKGA